MPAGRPTKYLPDFHPQDFIEKSKQGMHLFEIAGSWEVRRSTLYEWANNYPEFSDAMEVGKELSERWYMTLGRTGMVEQAKINGQPVKIDFRMYKWLTQNKFRWSEKIETENVNTTAVSGDITYTTQWGNTQEPTDGKPESDAVQPAPGPAQDPSKQE